MSNYPACKEPQQEWEPLDSSPVSFRKNARPNQTIPSAAFEPVKWA